MRRAAAGALLLFLLFPAVAGASVNDPYYSLQWGLMRIGAPTAWAVSEGAGQIVAVVDTGVDLAHPDLQGQFVPGYDFVDNDANPVDQNGHGTLIAGIIAAVTGNAVGVASVAPKAKIMPVRVLGPDGSGSSTTVAEGITWAVQHGATVVNLSLAQESGANNTPLLRSPAVDAAIKAAAKAGAVVVVAAGNSSTGGSNQTAYDATTPGVIVVGASARNNQPAAYSDHGPGLDILAPGGGSSTDPTANGCTQDQSIVSTWWNPNTKHSSYGGGCGTSMSVAFVSGVAALLRTHGYDNAAAIDRIEQTADDIGAKGRDDLSGYGILDAARALGARAVVPKTRKGTGHPQPATNRVKAAGSARAVPTSGSTPSKVPKVPTVAAVGPLDIGGSKRGVQVTVAAGLIGALIVGHALRALATRRT
ncbi:MAG TPA: S8 family serine peptidase [Actinomycetota bacterium]|nr:S8 family serine peptidase [Actinomycetota bacterium]